MRPANARTVTAWGRIVLLGLGLAALPVRPGVAAGDDGDVRRAKQGQRDGDAPRAKDGARDGDVPRTRDGERAREGERPRDGDRPAVDAQATGSGTFVRFEPGAMLLSDDVNDKDVRVAVKEGTKLNIDGQPSSLRELRPGMPVTATRQEGVTTIEAKRPRWMKLLTPPRVEGDRPREVRREGDDAALSIEERMRIRRAQEIERRRGEGEGIGGDAEGARRIGEGERPRDVRREGGDAKGSDLTIEERIKLRRAEQLGQPAPTVGQVTRGVVQKVDGASLVILVGEGSRELVVQTDETTKVMISGEPGKLSDLRPGTPVSVRQVEGKTVQVEARPNRL